MPTNGNTRTRSVSVPWPQRPSSASRLKSSVVRCSSFLCITSKAVTVEMTWAVHHAWKERSLCKQSMEVVARLLERTTRDDKSTKSLQPTEPINPTELSKQRAMYDILKPHPLYAKVEVELRKNGKQSRASYKRHGLQSNLSTEICTMIYRAICRQKSAPYPKTPWRKWTRLKRLLHAVHVQRALRRGRLL